MVLLCLERAVNPVQGLIITTQDELLLFTKVPATIFVGKISAFLCFEVEVNVSQRYTLKRQFLKEPFKRHTDYENVLLVLLFQISHCSDRLDLFTAFNGDVCCIQHYRNYSVEQCGSRQPP